MSTLLEAHAVSKHFATQPDWWRRLTGRGNDRARLVKAVDRVSFTLRAGEIFGLLGQSGSGKTTLARLLLRLDAPTSGRITFDDQDITAMPDAALKTHLRRKARMLFQHPDAALNPAFTVAQILGQALKTNTAVLAAERAERAAALLDAVGLPPSYLIKHPRALSTGEKRRVSIGRALATDPVLLIADEPVSGLDVTLQGQILDLLMRLHDERGLTLMLIAHDVNLIRALCTRIAVMYAGRLVEIGPRDAVSPDACRHPYTRALFDARLPRSPTASTGATALSAPALPAAAVTGCPYRPACARWRDLGQPEQCLHEHPDLTPAGDDHEAACHFAREKLSL